MYSRIDVLKRMISPRSIAIVGASSDPNKLSGRPLHNLVVKGYKGQIYPVNPNRSIVAGLQCYPSIAAIPDVPDVAFIAVPARLVLQSVEALGQKGVRAAVIYSSGFGETSAEGKQLELKLLECARAHDIAICGPNTLGFINALDNIYASFSQYDGKQDLDGSIAFVSQSGAFGTAISTLANQRGLGLGYFLNTGNQIDVSFSELMLAVAEDPRIKVLAGYLEGVTDGPALINLAKRCGELQKPLVLIKVGRKAAGARAAASHTGSLAVEDAIFDAVLRQYGVIRARNEEHTLDILEALRAGRNALGNSIGIVTQSGGAGAMMADSAEDAGLTVPLLPDDIRGIINSRIPDFGSTSNPIDITGQFVSDPGMLTETAVTMLGSDVVHIGIIWLQLMSANVDILVAIFKEIQRRTNKPFLVCWVAAPEEAKSRLRALNIPVYSSGDRAIDGAKALADIYMHSRRAKHPEELPALPPDSASANIEDGLQSTLSATARLRALGLPMADVRLAISEDDAVDYWKRGGSPVALKIESPDIYHKTDLGGVLLNLNNEQEVRKGYRQIIENISAAVTKPRITGILVQPMSESDLELVIGVKRDPSFGMLVMVGIGGIFIEILNDVSFRLAPFGPSEALTMLSELRAAPLFEDFRGRSAVDKLKIAELLSLLSVWANDMRSELVELDLNPVLVTPTTICIVDCLLKFEGTKR